MHSPTDGGDNSDIALNTASDAPPNGDAAAGGKVRSAIAIILGVLAIVALIATTVAVWAWAIVLDSDQVADIVDDALAEPEVEAALADYVTQQVFSAVDVDAVVSDVLPDDLDRLEPAIAAGLQTAVDRGVTRALSSPEVQEIITQIIERAHSRAMDLLQGDGISGAVCSRRRGHRQPPAADRARPHPAAGTWTVRRPADPGTTCILADGDPSEQIAALEEATGRFSLRLRAARCVRQRPTRRPSSLTRERPADSSPGQGAVWLLVILTTVLLVATVVVARNRWRAALWLGLGGVVAMVVTRSLVHRVVNEAPEIAATSGGQAAISAIVDGAATSLLRLAAVILIIAAVAAALAMFRRHWRRADFVLVGAVLTFVVIVAVLGVSIISLLLGVVVALLVPMAVRQLA